MEDKYKILLISDSSEDASLSEGILQPARAAFELVFIRGFEEGYARLNTGEFDVLLVDLCGVNGAGEDVLNRLRDSATVTPAVVLTDSKNASLGLHALQIGARDYLVRDHGDGEALLHVLRHTAERGKTERALRESEARYRRLLESVTDYVYTVRVENGRPVASTHGPGCSAVTGYACEEYAADPYLWYRMIYDDDRPAVVDMTNQIFSGKTPPPLEHRILHKDGSIRWIKNTPVPRFDQQGRLIAYDGLVADITERKLAEQMLKHVAYYDGLTDLPNRELFGDRLRQALLQARRHGKMLGVLFLDLDRFKGINDTLGHRNGDLLLRAAARRFVRCVRDGDTVARLGGDEFIVLCTDMAQPQDAAFVAQKIHEALSDSFTLEGEELFLTTSIGISLFPADGADVDTLIKNADVALYEAKALGRNNYQFYTPAMNAKALDKLVLENRLWKALERKEFIVMYQPLFDLASGRITGAEALVRWQHPVLGLLQPMEFIPLAEETGLIIPMGDWILQNVCRQAKAWNEAGVPPFHVSVNLSMRQFTHNTVMTAVLQALKQAELEPCLLELELTESMVMQNAEQTIATMHALKAKGIQLSLDDFGTGYSSLSYLKNLPLNKLKLDQSFVCALAKETKNEAISRAIISLAHGLDLKVIAEGVETTDQLELLRSLQCDEVQGFLFSRPVTAQEMGRLMNDDRLRSEGHPFLRTAA